MKYLIIIATTCTLLGFSGLFNPQSKKITSTFFPDIDMEINTPAFQKKKGYTNYNDLIGFISALQKQHAEIMKIEYIGESQKGKQIPMITLNKTSSHKKVKVWLQGGLHGDEMASTEGVLFLLDKLLNDPSYSNLLDKLEIGIIPMANIDGYEKENRYAANGLDLNRDQTKLIVKESLFLKKAFSDFNAHVALDFHEYRPFRRDFVHLGNMGVTSRHDAMFMYSGNLNVPKNIREYTREVFVKTASELLAKENFSSREYITSTKVYGDIHFSEGSNNARSSATSYALANTISSLIEIRGVGIGRTSFKRRVYTTFLIGQSYLKTAFNQADEVRKVIAQATMAQQEAVVTSEKEIRSEAITFIDLESNKEIEINAFVHSASKSKAVIKRHRPFAYLLHQNQLALVEKLKVLGLKVEVLSTDKEVMVEAFAITAYEREPYKYEGVYRQKVSTQITSRKQRLSAGTFVVYMNQDKANLAIETLEPEAPNSFVTFGLLETYKGDKLPIYRYLKEERL